MGDVPAAVDDYRGIPAATRARLQARMKRFAYDDIVAIRRDGIEGNFSYEPALRDMHFGARRLCGQVTRQSWRPDHEERGLAYCEGSDCVVVPLVCRNVSRIFRKPGVARMGGPAAPAEPLVFEAPGAGLPPGPRPLEGAEPLPGSVLAPPPPVYRIPPATADLPFAAPPLPPPLSGPEVPGTQPPWPPTPVMPPVATPTPGVPPLPPAPAVPEPATALLWAAGLAVAALWARRRGGGRR